MKENGLNTASVRRWRRYPSYRPCQTDWLREVPEHWRVIRLKFVADLQTGLTLGKDYSGRLVVTRPYLRVANVQDGYLDLDDITEIDVRAEDATRYELLPGDVLMTEGGDFDKLGRGYVWEGQIPGCLHQNHVFAVRPHPDQLDSWFLAALMTSSHGKTYFTSTSQQTTNLATTNSTKLNNFPLLLPSLAEQRAITAFLDRDTARIDGLIEQKERLIALLEEKRQAVISQAITRGLNPSAPLKDSGVLWLGKIPALWKVQRLKMLIRRGTSISYGIVQPGENVPSGVPFVQTTDMTSGNFDLSTLSRTSGEIAARYPRSRLVPGDVLLGIRASIGAAHVAPSHLAGANLSRGVARITLGDELAAEFACLYLRSRCAQEYWELAKQGSTFNEISIETVRELPVLVPPLEEQKKIIKELNAVSSLLDRVCSRVKEQIGKLQEYRTALISAAVTGQIDVRQEFPA